jgi:hypothetical protein
MFLGLIPRTTDFDTHHDRRQEGLKGRLGVVAKKCALQQPEIKSKKTINALFT